VQRNMRTGIRGRQGQTIASGQHVFADARRELPHGFDDHLQLIFRQNVFPQTMSL